MEIKEPISRSSNLIDAKDCFVLIIDVQKPFMVGLSDNDKILFIKKYIHLIKLCDLLNIPYIITVENIQKNGSIPDDIINEIKANNLLAKIIEKYIYSCWGQKEIREEISKTKRFVAILCGFETDVCISQTAIDLISNNYKTVILVDITYSRNKFEHRIGLKRMEYHGAIFSHLKTWQEEITAGIMTKINKLIKDNNLSDI